MIKILVLMPTFNEISTLESSVRQLLSINPQLDVLVIDDNSPDGTGYLADQLAKEDARVHVLHRSEKSGLGRAYIAGFRWGIAQGYELLVQMDADGSHRPEDLPALLAKAQEAELVIGSRWIPGGEVKNWPKSRQLISRLGNWYAAAALDSVIKDMTAGFRIYQTELVRRLNLNSIEAQGYGFQVEMTYQTQRLGSKVIEVPIQFIERENGVSKMTFDIVIEAFLLCTKWGILRLIRR
jgi:glycosyltransferase involved in cell wall biosynthesis